MTDKELKPCPFCGGKAEIRKGQIYYTACVQAHCTKCGVSTPKVPIDHQFYTCGKTVTLSEEKAIQKAANDWNRRADK